jgi:membrane-associated protease RseP (regulator of RpoE activity)
VPSDRRWLPLALFLATLGSTMYIGGWYHAYFLADYAGETPPYALLPGAWYSFTILAILGTHELGHYYACRYYGIDASLPYFLPAPFLAGTVGAFIRIRQRIPTKAMLFDVGAAGPIAGFIVAVPALFGGLMLSRVTPIPELDAGALMLGEPLLFKAVAWLIWGALPEGHTISLHPMGFAAWFGLLATALNLFPIGQLDGGHISYAVFGARSTLVTLASAAVLFALAFHSPSWIVWAVLMVVMLVTLGPRHPRTLDHDVPIDRTRMLVAGFALVIFVLCFTPAPIQIIGELGQ